jgi:hypothetical protein
MKKLMMITALMSIGILFIAPAAEATLVEALAEAEAAAPDAAPEALAKKQQQQDNQQQ